MALTLEQAESRRRLVEEMIAQHTEVCQAVDKVLEQSGVAPNLYVQYIVSDFLFGELRFYVLAGAKPDRRRLPERKFIEGKWQDAYKPVPRERELFRDCATAVAENFPQYDVKRASPNNGEWHYVVYKIVPKEWRVRWQQKF